MKRVSKICAGATLILALSMAGNVQASHTWTDADPGDSLWSTAGNWDQGTLPGSGDWVKLRNGLSVTIINPGAVSKKTHLGYTGGATLTVDGGTLQTVGDDLLLGKQSGTGILNMIGGSISVGKDLEVGTEGVLGNTINMTSGTITVHDDFEIGHGSSGATGIVNLDGGTIILDGSYEDDGHLRMYTGSLLNFGGGTLILVGNSVSKVEGYFDSGLITSDLGGISATFDGANTTVIGVVPEPATMLLLGLGGMLIRRKK